jgi:hypothetical protein
MVKNLMQARKNIKIMEKILIMEIYKKMKIRKKIIQLKTDNINGYSIKRYTVIINEN